MSWQLSASLVFWPIILPLLTALLAVLGGRRSERPALVGSVLTVIAVLALCRQYLEQDALIHRLGGWPPLLGISLRADGPSLLMLLLTAVIGVNVSFYARGYFAHSTSRPGESQNIRQRYFWPLWLMLWAGLDCLFLSGDLFNIYVALEVVSLSSVGLAALSGEPASLVASLRYLLVSLLGSLSYLLGVGFIYKTYAMLDLASLQAVLEPVPAVRAGMALISLGLLLKTALFPLHFWLAPAHANAPAPVSAVLSGLVIKAPWYLLFRFWFELFPRNSVFPAIHFFALCGAGAIFWGGFQALRQERLKMLVAYSTVAQVGYFFIIFPLVPLAADNAARNGAFCFILSHGCAKAAMFLAAGALFVQAGHDLIARLDGIRRQAPVAGFAFGMAGISLMGLPPSGGFIAKYQYLSIAAHQGQWWLVWIILAGSLLTAAYVYRAVSHILRPVGDRPREPVLVSAAPQWSAFFLALASMLLGFAGPFISTFLEAGA